MKTLSLSIFLVVASGCVQARYMTIGAPAPLEAAAPGLSADGAWRLGEVHISVETQADGSTTTPSVDTELLQRQLLDRVRATLLAQSGLGATTGLPKYALEVDLEAIERYGLGRQFGVALALEAGLMVVGMTVGGLVGMATSAEPRPTFLNSGQLVGLGGGLAAALVASTFPKIAGTKGEYKAHLVLRRLADRVPVAERRVERRWRLDQNLYDANEKLARGAGEGFVEFEKVLLSAVKDLLLEAAPEAPPAPPAP